MNNNPDFLPSLTTDLANKKAAIADSEERRPEMINGPLIRNPLRHFYALYFEGNRLHLFFRSR